MSGPAIAMELHRVGDKVFNALDPTRSDIDKMSFIASRAGTVNDHPTKIPATVWALYPDIAVFTPMREMQWYGDAASRGGWVNLMKMLTEVVRLAGASNQRPLATAFNCGVTRVEENEEGVHASESLSLFCFAPDDYKVGLLPKKSFTWLWATPEPSEVVRATQTALFTA